MEKLLFADAHSHINPIRGLGARRIASKFKNSGGWFIALVSLPPYYYGFNDLTIENYAKTIELLINEAKIMRSYGLKVKLLAGFHPAEVDEHFRRGRDLKYIVEFADEVFKLIIDYHRKGYIDGIGEVGRQHYSTAPSRIIASELILIKAMEYARDHDMIMHLHLEQGGWVTVESIDKLRRITGIMREKVFLHHVDYETSVWSEKYGYWYTVPAKKRILSKVLSEKRNYILVESDFIDDPDRPGVSSYPWDIPKRIKELLSEGIINVENVYRSMIDNIVKAYRVEPP
ncbi:TatD-related deoxyribonuclease [Staphylothermus marinus F1]|uniref:TatD-related deoxyribonuclease n=1 Tax=Staphylothermus marinus (strain ATCC 43588 / DSM 3639 / JCM 9404 / F1) TaxID=399550 RepID=A3DLS6_STAMF|nr:TatD family hydrolase [Staphylothermus marinus]ABN69586.1 TatD-related deoxyribonuclease [Staphylothermus marinus F1]